MKELACCDVSLSVYVLIDIQLHSPYLFAFVEIETFTGSENIEFS